MASPAFDPDRVVRLLARDVSLTLGDGFHEVVFSVAENTRSIATGLMERGEGDGHGIEAEEAYSVEEVQRYFGQKVVDDFQQYIHDMHIDTTWPACPRHPNHPLDYKHETGAWCCPRDGMVIFPLGELVP